MSQWAPVRKACIPVLWLSVSLARGKFASANAPLVVIAGVLKIALRVGERNCRQSWASRWLLSVVVMSVHSAILGRGIDLLRQTGQALG